MKIDSTNSIIEISVQFQKTIPLFNQFNIDYLNGGRLSLKDGCEKAGVPLEEIISHLEKLKPIEYSGTHSQYKELSFSELINFILKKYHEPAYSQLLELKNLSTQIKKNRETSFQNSFLLDVHIQELADQMKGHMAEEEKLIFPYLVETEKELTRGKIVKNKFLDLPFNSHPLNVLAWEHEIADNEFTKLRGLTKNYTPPEDTNDSLKTLYQSLKQMDVDTHQHIFLENDVLFQKAIQIKILN